MRQNQEQKDKTFIVKIKYSQNHSIQGFIQWIEKEKTLNFRSEMELLSLLCEAADIKEIRSWKNEEPALSVVNGSHYFHKVVTD